MAPPAEDGADWKDQNGEAADLAQTYRDLVRGEQAAAALEASLTTLESKLDAMLEALEDKADASSPAADAKAPATDAKIEDKAQANTSGNEKPAGHGSSKTAE